MMVQLFLTYYLAGLLLLTNIGVPVFRHICHTQQKSWSSIYIPARSCCSKKNQDGSSFECRPANSDLPNITKRPCCENKSGLIIMATDFCKNEVDFSKVASKVFKFPATLFDVSSLPIHKLFSGAIKIHGPPDFLFGRSLLIAFQVFRC